MNVLDYRVHLPKERNLFKIEKEIVWVITLFFRGERKKLVEVHEPYTCEIR